MTDYNPLLSVIQLQFGSNSQIQHRAQKLITFRKQNQSESPDFDILNLLAKFTKIYQKSIDKIKIIYYHIGK